MLAAVVALYVAATAAGARQGSGSVQSGGLPEALGRVLVLPAASGDVLAAVPGCRRGSDLTAAAGRDCRYRLKSGFLGKRLRLTVVAGTAVDATVTQKPSPEVSDSQTLALGRSHDFIYREERSQLALVCQSVVPCRVRLG